MPLGDAHHAKHGLVTEGSKGQLVDVALGIDADTLQRGLKLLQVFRQHAVVQFSSGLGVDDLAVIHGDNLLHIGRNHRARSAG